jgi:hypothetical protein
MLSELEEIISYKEATAVGNNERRAVIQKTWMKRFVLFLPSSSVFGSSQLTHILSQTQGL